jgi:hypothetical protein
MRIFKLFKTDGTLIIHRTNKLGLYTSLKNAKIALIQFLRKNKHKDIKSEDCYIMEYDLVEKDKHRV